MGTALDYRIVVIGGGGTGAALAHDLTLRGFTVTLLERGELTCGTTGRHHGLLHSGARYAVSDHSVAQECMRETRILRRIAPDVIEFNWGLFIALDEEDVHYTKPFLQACAKAKIPTRMISGEAARRAEPNLSPAARHAVLVPDGVIDAWRLPLRFYATARRHGATIHTFTPAIAIETQGGRVTAVVGRELRTGRELRFNCDLAIGAAGAWGSKVAQLCDLKVALTPMAGSMVAVRGRLTNMVVSRLRPPGEGDIIVPQRRLSIIGATQWPADDLEVCTAPPDDIELLTANATHMLPAFGRAEFHAAWAAVRPLSGEQNAAQGDDGDPDAGSREPGSTDHESTMSRGFRCIDHAREDGVEGFISIIGGKATVLRAMAEQGADLACRKLGVTVACTTRESPLASHRDYYRRHSA